MVQLVASIGWQAREVGRSMEVFPTTAALISFPH
jgi:hypothetical protein